MFPKPKQFKFIFIIAFLLTNCYSNGQSTGTLKGEIRDKEKSQPLPGASVYNLKNSTQLAIADNDGKFQLDLPSGQHAMVCTFIGMLSDTFNITIEADKATQHNLFLVSQNREMDVVVVSASKYEQRLDEVTVSMQLIQPRMIESKNTVNVKTVLEQSPGLTILDEEPQMRGGSGFSFGVGSRVATLIDGLPILTGDAGRTDWNFIPTENIEQIEIIEGASSVLYGSSALSGTINFRTKFPKDSSSTYVRTYTGFYSTPQNPEAKWWEGAANFSGMNFSHAQKMKQNDLIIGGQVNYDHNYIGPYILDGSLPIKADTLSNPDVANRSGRFNFNYRYRPSKINGLSMGINGNIMMGHTNFSLVWGNDTDGIYRAFPGTMTLTDFTAFYVDPFLTYFTPSGYKHSIRGRLYSTNNDNSNGQSNSARVYIGEYQFFKSIEKLDNLNITGGVLINQTYSHANLYSASGSPDNTWKNFAGYVQLDKKFFNVLNASVGFREEHFQVNNSQAVWQPIFRAGLNLKLSNYTNIRYSYGQGFRYPTITERFITTTTGGIYIFPNAEIQPESSWSTEAGIKQRIKIKNFLAYADFVAFWQEFHNTIEYVYAIWQPDLAGFKFLNTGNTRVKGYEISFTGSGKLLKNLGINVLAGYTYILPQTLSPDLVFATDNPEPGIIPTELTYANTSTDTTNNILKYRFQHLIKADVEFIYKNLALGISGRYYSFMQNIDQTFYTLDQPFLLPTGITEYRKVHDNGSVVFDARISYSFAKYFNVAFISNNVANLEYSLRPVKIEAPRTFVLQVSAKF